MIIIQLKPKKEESLLRFHPWVFSGAIQSINGKPSEGELVDITREYERYLRKDTFWDQFNRGNRLMFVSLGLLAYFFMTLISSLMGLV